MRIIAGEFRGRHIEAPPGTATRPMLDRVREALFSTLGNLVEDAHVLDLFAGTGSLALECLSRGAEHARMVESDRATVRLLRANVKTLGLEDYAEVVQSDALSPSSWSRAGEPAPARYDLIFFDPPYPIVDDPRGHGSILSALHELVAQHLKPGGELVFHARRGRVRTEEFSRLSARVREYGTNALWYLRPAAPPEPAP